MTGMKSGPTDLWDDDQAEEEESPDDDIVEGDDLQGAESAATTPKDGSSEPESDNNTTTDRTAEQSTEIPYITRRRSNGEATTWQRSRLTFFVREHIEDGERELKSEVESQLGEDISKFDLREAAYLVAQNNPDAVAKKLEEMGVGFKL